MRRLFFVFDYHNTISERPLPFSRLTKGHNVYIVTGAPESQREKIEKRIRQAKVRIHYKKLIMCPFDWNFETQVDSKKWKVKQIALLEPDFFFDDNDAVLDAVKLRSPHTVCCKVKKEDLLDKIEVKE